MDILSELEVFINEFNQYNDMNFEIDSIRIEFSKQYKLEKLKEVGQWEKVRKNSNILHKLKKRLAVDEVTSAYRLEKLNIYFYNKKDDTKKYRKAEMVIFGMKQYHKAPPPYYLIEKIISILKDVSNIDLCFDMKQIPNIEALNRYFKIKRYIEPKSGKPTQTYYINSTMNDMIEKVTIYNKALKNNLEGILWRIEAKILIPNTKYLALPLHEVKQIVDLAKGNNG